MLTNFPVALKQAALFRYSDCGRMADKRELISSVENARYRRRYVCHQVSGKPFGSTRSKQRLPDVFWRQHRDRLIQLCVWTPAPYDANVTETASLIGFDRVDLNMVLWCNDCLPFKPELPTFGH